MENTVKQGISRGSSMSHMIFFSWQADTPTRDGRNFIEKALRTAIKDFEQLRVWPTFWSHFWHARRPERVVCSLCEEIGT